MRAPTSPSRREYCNISPQVVQRCIGESIAVGDLIDPPLRTDDEFRVVTDGAGDHVDHSAQGVASVQCGCGALDDFDLVEIE